MKKAVCCVCLMALAWGGCKKHDDAAPKAANASSNVVASVAPKAYAKMSEVPAKTVVLKINGYGITRAYYDQYLGMMCALYANRHPSVNDEKMRIVRSRMRMSALSQILGRVALYTHFSTNSVKPTAALRSELEADYTKTFCRKQQKFDDLEELMASKGYDGLFTTIFTEDLKVRAVMQSLYRDRLTVTDADVALATANVSNYNARATATNELIIASLKQALAKLDAGADFAKVAEEYSKIPGDGPGGDIGNCDLSDFDNEPDEYRIAVAQLKTGDRTGALDGEQTYDILRCIEFLPKDKSDSGVPTWHLARISFPKPYFMTETSGQELIDELAKEKRDGVIEQLLPALMKAAKVEFPCGKRIFGPTEAGGNGKGLKSK